MASKLTVKDLAAQRRTEKFRQPQNASLVGMDGSELVFVGKTNRQAIS